MSNHNEISSFIWNVCDDVLRGLFKQHEYGDVILPFVVLRRLDCVLEGKKDEIISTYEQYKSNIDSVDRIVQTRLNLKFFNHSKYDLVRLKDEPNKIQENINEYLQSFSSNVNDIIKNFGLEKHIDKLESNNKLYLLVEKFTEVNLHPSVVDNHTMGNIFEELLRRFSEMSNETSGEHYTPRDVVKLLVSLVFNGDEDNLKGEGIIRSIFDPCCGTGGMLTIGKEWVNENISSDVMFQLYGQELNPQTFSICKSDFLITGEDPERIKLGTSLSSDQHEGRTFDYMITNPPFGISWKSEKDFVIEESKNPMGRFSVGTPRTSDSSLLFLQHMISKMKPEGSRIGVVFNGSPLFSGDSGSGESEIRKWIIENDWLECIVSLPNNLFFNTGITTYIWIVTNNKKPHRKGKTQLINCESFFKVMKKKLGEKRKEIDEPLRQKILQLHSNFEENEYSKIFENDFFGYNRIQIEQPKVEDGIVLRDKKGNPKPDSKLKDFERVPLHSDIEEYYSREVKPHLPNSWINHDKTLKGYEINFTKYFYQYKPLRSSQDIVKDIIELDSEIEGFQKQILE